MKIDPIPGQKNKFLVHANDQLQIAEISPNLSKIQPLVSRLYRSFNTLSNRHTDKVFELAAINQQYGLIVYNDGQVILVDIINLQIKGQWQIEDPFHNPFIISRDKKYLYSLDRSRKRISRIEILTGNQLDLNLQISRNANLGAAKTPTQILAQYQYSFDIMTEMTNDPDSLYLTVNGGWDLYRIEKSTAAITPIRLEARPKQDPLRFHHPMNGPNLIASTSHSLQNRDEMEFVEQSADPAVPLKRSIIKHTDIGYFLDNVALIPGSQSLVVGTISYGLLLVDLPSRSVVETNAFQSPNYTYHPQAVGDAGLVSLDVSWSKNQADVYFYAP
jgi:hypothetical protein